MEILTFPSVRGSGVTAVHVSVHVDGQAQAWVNTYPRFVTVEICQRSAAVSVFVQNVDQADELIQLLQIARAELVSLSTASSSTAAGTGLSVSAVLSVSPVSPVTPCSSVSVDSSAAGV